MNSPLAENALVAIEAPQPAGNPHMRSVLAISVILRAAIAVLTLRLHSPEWFFSNAADLGYLAQSLASGRGLSSPFGGSTGPSALVTPGYPLLVAPVFSLFGSCSQASAVAVILLQILFASLTVATTMHVTNCLFGYRTANLAGSLWAISPPLLWLPLLFWETSLSILMLTVCMALALRLAQEPSRGMWMLAGAYCGIALLVNPALLLAMLAMLAWAAVKVCAVSRYDLLLGVLAMMAVFAPWPIRNTLIMHSPILLRSSFGYEVWQGNRFNSDGVFDDNLYPLHSPAEYAAYAAMGEVDYMREKSALAYVDIRAHPSVFIRLTAKRVAAFWIGKHEGRNLLVVELHTATTLLLGLAGLILLVRRRAAFAMLFLWPLILFPLPYYITDVRYRYRLVIDPIMTILSAYALTSSMAYFKTIRGRRRRKQNLG